MKVRIPSRVSEENAVVLANNIHFITFSSLLEGSDHMAPPSIFLPLYNTTLQK